MKQLSYNMNISPKNDLIKEDSADRLLLGGSLVLGASFDIKQYLNNIQYLQKTSKGQKTSFHPFIDNLYKRTKLRNKKYELSTITNGYSPKNYNKSVQRKNPSLDGSTTATNYNYTVTMRNYKNSSFNTNNDYYSTANDRLKSYKSTKDYFKTESNTKSLFSYKNNNNNLYDSSNENLNLLKTIKTIKKNIDMSHKDKSIISILNSKIVYDPKNEDAVFRPIKIINEFKNFEKCDLDKNKYDITSFITNSQKISKRNVILKLLDNKKKDCIRSIIQRQKTFENNKKTINIDEINFECYTENQKQANRRIEKKLAELLVKNRRLLLEERKFRSDLRVKEDERQRYLEQIDELRIVAKFVTKVIGNSLDLINLFKIKILPEYSAERLPNYEKIGKEVIERFRFLLDEDKINNDTNSKFNQKDINILKEMHSLNNFELFYDQFYEVERKIIKSMKEKKEINSEILEIQKEERKNIAEIQKTLEHLKKELSIIQSEYDKERALYEAKININEIGNLDLDGIVYDLYFEVMFIFGKLKLDKDNKINLSKESVGVNDALREIRSLIIDSEEKMNKYIKLLEVYEKSDKFLFGRICNHIKNSHKEKKVNLLKQIIADGEKQRIDQIDQMMENKIIFIKRKAEPPFHLPKKEKKIKIDPELVKRLENEELITYK